MILFWDLISFAPIAARHRFSCAIVTHLAEKNYSSRRPDSQSFLCVAVTGKTEKTKQKNSSRICRLMPIVRSFRLRKQITAETSSNSIRSSGPALFHPRFFPHLRSRQCSRWAARATETDDVAEHIPVSARNRFIYCALP